MTNQPTIALAMIVKDEADKLRRCLQSAAPFVDAIYITHTGEGEGVKRVCDEFKAHYSTGSFRHTADQAMVDWLKEFFGYDPQTKVGDALFRFDEARNFNFGQVPKEVDFILWLDADDVLRRGENLRRVAQVAREHGIEATYFNYLYQVELLQDDPPIVKHVLIEHLRERLVVNSGVYKWIAPIHETLIEQKPTRKTDNYDCDVVHLASDEDRVASLQRNLKTLELAIYQSKGKDPRHVYYLAKALYDLRTPEYDEKLIPLINRYLWGEDKSGWPEERAQACEYLAEVYRRNGQLNNAVKAAMNGLIEEPNNPSLYLCLASTYLVKNEWERALFWAKQATGIPAKKTTLVRNPKDLQIRTLEVIYNACLNLSQIDEAWAAATKLVELLPDDALLQQTYRFVSQLRTERDLTRQLVGMADYLTKTGEVG